MIIRRKTVRRWLWLPYLLQFWWIPPVVTPWPSGEFWSSHPSFSVFCSVLMIIFWIINGIAILGTIEATKTHRHFCVPFWHSGVVTWEEGEAAFLRSRKRQERKSLKRSKINWLESSPEKREYMINPFEGNVKNHERDVT